MVLGHDKCGAAEDVVKGAETSGHIVSIVKAIAPAVQKAKISPATCWRMRSGKMLRWRLIA